ncbi:MAG TPA: Flp pilus assembly protein CpaB [Gemmatimonadaceae bacterium]|nr:Flp pilus assembly protein CpaB [Gemmatimonadaceae bacterium]
MGGRYKMIFWGALIVAGIATFGAYRLLSARSDSGKVPMVPVVLAVHDIPEGASIERSAVTVSTWAAPTVPVGAYSTVDSVIGRVTRVNVFNGEVIVPGRLAPAGTGPGIELKIPPGQRAMAVSINDVAGISGLIQPNSRVDVMVTSTDLATQKQTAKLFMENMRVLSVGTAIQRDASGKPISAPSVTLGVTPEQAERLAIAMNQGAIQLVLRGYGDPDSIRTRGATTSDVFSQLRGAPLPPPVTAEAPRRASSPRRAALPPPPVIIMRPPPAPPPPDSVIVHVYRGGKGTPEKFDTTRKR